MTAGVSHNGHATPIGAQRLVGLLLESTRLVGIMFVAFSRRTEASFGYSFAPRPPRVSDCWGGSLDCHAPIQQRGPTSRFGTIRPATHSPVDPEPLEWSDFDDFIGSVAPSPAVPDATRDVVSFNDFGESAVGDEIDTKVGVLQERIQSMQAVQYRQDAVDSRNWNLGNWNVRGFSMETATETTSDTDDPSTESSSGVRVTCIVQERRPKDADGVRSPDVEAVVWVGRSDGQVFGVRLGTEYMTALGGSAEERTDRTVQGGGGQPNEIVAQLVGLPHAMDHLTAIADPDNDEQTYVFAASHSGENLIQQWRVNSSGTSSESPTIPTQSNVPLPNWAREHCLPVVSLQAIQLTTKEGPLLVLVVANGASLSIWDVRSSTWLGHVAVTVAHQENDAVRDAQGSIVSSVMATESHIYVGTTTGQIVAYDLSELLSISSGSEMPKPTIAAQWRASDHPITALSSGGQGTLGSSGPAAAGRSATMVLYTGDSKGHVKRWEVLNGSAPGQPPAVQRLDAWPKLTTQRLPKRAHLFSGHQGDVTAIAAINEIKFATASMDGTVRIWNAVTGKELCCLDGFGDPVRSLCLFDSLMEAAESKNTLIVTDGMNKYVCVHDFSTDDQDADYDLDMPEYRT